MKLAPVFWKVDRSPAAGYLGEVRCIVRRQVFGCEGRPSVEKLPAFKSRFDILLLIKADAEQVGRPVPFLSVSANLSNTKGKGTKKSAPVPKQSHLNPCVKQGRQFYIIL